MPVIYKPAHIYYIIFLQEAAAEGEFEVTCISEGNRFFLIICEECHDLKSEKSLSFVILDKASLYKKVISRII